MVLNRACNSISAIYRTQIQMVTGINAAHSGFLFAFAKVNKKSGFCKVFARKSEAADLSLQSFSH